MPDEYVSAAIGKNGQNVKLASQVTGYDIRLLKEGSEDIDIREFDIEIGKEAVERLVENNINTAREFLEVSPEILLSIEGLNYDIIIDARKAMLIEFDEDEDENYINLLKQAANYSAEEDSDNQVDNIEDSNIVTEQEKEEQTSEDITENTEEVDEKENE